MKVNKSVFIVIIVIIVILLITVTGFKAREKFPNFKITKSSKSIQEHINRFPDSITFDYKKGFIIFDNVYVRRPNDNQLLKLRVALLDKSFYDNKEIKEQYINLGEELSAYLSDKFITQDTNMITMDAVRTAIKEYVSKTRHNDNCSIYIERVF